MGYYMRYLVTDERKIDLPSLGSELKKLDPLYSINLRLGNIQAGEIVYNQGVYGLIEISQRSDDLFERELEEMKDEIEEMKGKGKSLVLRALSECQSMVVIQILFSDRKTEETLQKIDPLWSWLFANRAGLLQADGEGYYERRQLVLRVE